MKAKDAGRGPGQPAGGPAVAGPSTEILRLVTESLAHEPARADLWMTRFEVQRTLGLKREFADALVLAWRNPLLHGQLDWGAVRVLWNELAPGEPAPEGIPLPAPGAVPASTLTPPAAGRDRRFSDIANRIASRELAELAGAFGALQARPGFLEEFARRVAPLLKRPTPLQPAPALAGLYGNAAARIFLKREDLRSVSPELENAAAQCYVATAMGRLTAITGCDIDSHALALAEIAPRFGIKCIVVVRAGDLAAKPELVDALRRHGASVEMMPEGVGTDPRAGAVRLWQQAMGYAHLVLSPGAGPNPYPAMANTFQSLLGRETAQQLEPLAAAGRPQRWVAAVRGGADSIGFMLPHLSRADLELFYAEPPPGGDAAWRPSGRLSAYNGAAREHAWLRGLGRIEHVPVPDTEAAEAQQQVRQLENFGVSNEDARAVALAGRLIRRDAAPCDYVVLVA